MENRSAQKFRIAIWAGCAACVLFAFIFVSVYKWDNERVLSGGSAAEYAIGNETFLYCLDDASEVDGLFYARGWVVRQWKGTAHVNTQVALIDAADNVCLLNTVMEIRNEVTQSFDDGVNYDNAGFYGSCKVIKLEVDEAYEIGIVVIEDDVEYLIRTGFMYQRGAEQ